MEKKNSFPPPPPHRHFDAAAAPWVDSTLKVGSVGFAVVKCSTVGIEEIKDISILVGTDVPLTFWKMMLGVFDHSFGVFLGEKKKQESCQSCCVFF